MRSPCQKRADAAYEPTRKALRLSIAFQSLEQRQLVETFKRDNPGMTWGGMLEAFVLSQISKKD